MAQTPPEVARAVITPQNIIDNLAASGNIYKDPGQDFTLRDIEEIEALQDTYVQHYLNIPKATHNGIEVDFELAQSVLQSYLYGDIYRDHHRHHPQSMVKIMNTLIEQSGAGRATGEIVQEIRGRVNEMTVSRALQDASNTRGVINPNITIDNVSQVIGSIEAAANGTDLPEFTPVQVATVVDLNHLSLKSKSEREVVMKDEAGKMGKSIRQSKYFTENSPQAGDFADLQNHALAVRVYLNSAVDTYWGHIDLFENSRQNRALLSKLCRDLVLIDNTGSVLGDDQRGYYINNMYQLALDTLNLEGELPHLKGIEPLDDLEGLYQGAIAEGADISDIDDFMQVVVDIHNYDEDEL